MSRRTAGSSGAEAPGGGTGRGKGSVGGRESVSPPRVTVCRGCCCGSARKVPDLDHAAQLADMRQALDGLAGVRVSDCLDACEHANVVVIQPSAAGRAAGGRPVWLGLVNDTDAAADIAEWIRAGGPGLADPPPILDLYTFNPSRRVRQAMSS